jgi:hypothetical protein
MKPQDDLRNARFCSLCQPKTTNAAKAVKRSLFLGMAFALTIGAVQLSAQNPSDQPWPPDDDNGSNNGQPVPIPQYTPNQRYGSNQPQYPQDYPQQQQAYGNAPQQQGYGPTQPPLSPNDLTQLLAPIALYPDALVAQILTAATYPAEVSAADQWRRSMGNAPADQIAAGADAQTTWDPSVKALTAFPQVLDNLAGNLQWTTALGNAYYNQPQDVLQTIQVMRQRAQEAGNLQNTPQEQITDNGGYIDIAPANPQVVYVPLQSLGRLWSARRALSGLLLLRCPGLLLWRLARAIRSELRHGRLHAHALGLPRLGPRLARPFGDVQSQRLLDAEQQRARLGFPARRPACLPRQSAMDSRRRQIWIVPQQWRLQPRLVAAQQRLHP